MLKARAQEDREAAEKRSKEDREGAEKLTRELISAAEKRAQEDREVIRQIGAKNAAEHAELTAAVHGLENKVGVLLDRSNRPVSEGGAD